MNENRGIVAFDLANTTASEFRRRPDLSVPKGQRFGAVPGMRELFDDLRASGYRPVLVSDGMAVDSRGVDTQLGLIPEDLVCDAGDKRDAISRFARTAPVLAYVGDTPDDIRGPYREGVATVLFNWDTQGPIPADLVHEMMEAEALPTGSKVALGVDELRSILRSLGVDVPTTLDISGDSACGTPSGPGISVADAGDIGLFF